MKISKEQIKQVIRAYDTLIDTNAKVKTLDEVIERIYRKLNK